MVIGYCLRLIGLRLCLVLPSNSRMAYRDIVLPTGGGADGNSPIFVPKGTLVSFSTVALHQNVAIWGCDAEEFKPDRWEHERERNSWVRHYSRYLIKTVCTDPIYCRSSSLSMVDLEHVLVVNL